jgi:antitoxin component YwqK of YwqJK toxin-antitoxin module
VTDAGQPVPREDLHRDGSIRARGHELDGQLSGYWEWFRKDGSLLRSGWFDAGEQVGEWKTFDAAGQLVKSTDFTGKASTQ